MHARHHRSLQVRIPADEEAKAKQQEAQEAPVVEQEKQKEPTLLDANEAVATGARLAVSQEELPPVQAATVEHRPDTHVLKTLATGEHQVVRGAEVVWQLYQKQLIVPAAHEAAGMEVHSSLPAELPLSQEVVVEHQLWYHFSMRQASAEQRVSRLMTFAAPNEQQPEHWHLHHLE